MPFNFMKHWLIDLDIDLINAINASEYLWNCLNTRIRKYAMQKRIKMIKNVVPLYNEVKEHLLIS